MSTQQVMWNTKGSGLYTEREMGPTVIPLRSLDTATASIKPDLPPFATSFQINCALNVPPSKLCILRYKQRRLINHKYVSK
jgi:hypothetical protein